MIDGALGGPVEQEYLLQARQMQAMSFIVHIPLVCFGIAFPAMVLFLEGLWLRTGDPLYKGLAKRWSKAMLILFAVGVVTGTILSFEMGLLWPEFMATFGEVFGLAFGIEGFSFFMEAIFIAVYVYGWDRLPDRVHLAAGVPIVLAGISGSLMVISVNGWMNNPTGFRDRERRGRGRRAAQGALQRQPLARAGAHVPGRVHRGGLPGRRGVRVRLASRAARPAPPGRARGGAQRRRARHAGAAARRRLGRAHRRRAPAVKLAAFEGLQETTKGAGFELAGGIEIPKLLSLLAFHDPNAVVQGLDSVPEDDRPPVGIVKLSFRAMVAIGTALAALGAWFVWAWWRHGRLPGSPWFHRAVVAAGPLSVVALIAGWVTTEVGRQPWVVYEVMRTEEAVTGAGGIPVGFAALALVYAGLIAIAIVMLRRLGRQPFHAP